MQRLRKTAGAVGWGVLNAPGGTVQERATLTVCTETGAHRRAFRDALLFLNLACPRLNSRGRRADKRETRARHIATRHARTGRPLSPARAQALSRMLNDPGWPVAVSETRTDLSRRECKRRGLPPGSSICYSASYTVWGCRTDLETLTGCEFVLRVEWGSAPIPYRAAGAGALREKATGRPKQKPLRAPETLDRSLPPAHLMPCPIVAPAAEADPTPQDVFLHDGRRL